MFIVLSLSFFLIKSFGLLPHFTEKAFGIVWSNIQWFYFWLFRWPKSLSIFKRKFCFVFCITTWLRDLVSLPVMCFWELWVTMYVCVYYFCSLGFWIYFESNLWPIFVNCLCVLAKKPHSVSLFLNIYILYLQTMSFRLIYFKNMFIYLLLRAGEVQREGERESQAGSALSAHSWHRAPSHQLRDHDLCWNQETDS